MNQTIKKYIRQVQIQLHCTSKKRKEIMGGFLHSIEGYLSDYPDAKYEDIVQAFGTPLEMAQTLCEKIEDQSIEKYYQNKKRKIYFFTILFVLFAFCLVYINRKVIL